MRGNGSRQVNLNETMNDETLKLLADKLGVTIEHLWEVMVRQAPVTASIDTVTIMLAAALFLWLTIKGATIFKEDDDNAPAGAGALICGCITIILVLCFLGGLATNVSAFTNPEYWALKQLLSAIK